MTSESRSLVQQRSDRSAHLVEIVLTIDVVCSKSKLKNKTRTDRARLSVLRKSLN
jgi:hypothetical protein